MFTISTFPAQHPECGILEHYKLLSASVYYKALLCRCTSQRCFCVCMVTQADGADNVLMCVCVCVHRARMCVCIYVCALFCGRADI